MRTLLSILFHLFIVSSLMAQSTGIPVVVRIKKDNPVEMTLVGRADKNLKIQSKGSELTVPLTDIQQINFVFPKSFNQAQQAYFQGKWSDAINIVKPVVTPLLPYLDTPNNNLIPIVLTLADALRQANKLDDALTYFSKVASLPKSPNTIKASLWAAYCLAAQDKIDQASKQIETLDPIKRDNELFPLSKLVQAKIYFTKKDYQSAIDEAAQVIAFSRIESEFFPESLFTTAEIYEAMGKIKTAEKEEKAKKEQSQTLAKNTNDVQNVVENLDYQQVSQSIYQEITKNFPETAWAKKSQPKIKKPSTPAAPNSAAEDESKSKEKE